MSSSRHCLKLYRSVPLLPKYHLQEHMSCNSHQLSCSMPCLPTSKNCAHQLPCGLLQRMSAYDSQINAIREVNPDIMAEAASMDAMLPAYQSGAEEMPLLFCVPMLIKDNFDTGKETIHTFVMSASFCGCNDRSPTAPCC